MNVSILIIEPWELACDIFVPATLSRSETGIEIIELAEGIEYQGKLMLRFASSARVAKKSIAEALASLQADDTVTANMMPIAPAILGNGQFLMAEVRKR